jgi:hypothetical protein
VDLYQVTKMSEGHITYKRAKTRTVRADGTEISIKLEPEIMRLLKNTETKKERECLISIIDTQLLQDLTLQ